MIAWFLMIWSWFTKLSWIAKIISFFPTVKQYWKLIVIGLLVVYIGILHFLLVLEENKYLKCKNEYSTILQAINSGQKEAETNAKSASELIKKNNEINKVVKAKIEVETKNETDAIAIMRRYL
jgi:cytochrome c biogenesis protein CcdA